MDKELHRNVGNPPPLASKSMQNQFKGFFVLNKQQLEKAGKNPKLLNSDHPKYTKAISGSCS